MQGDRWIDKTWAVIDSCSRLFDPTDADAGGEERLL
jgi:hypothetical protein